MANNKRKISKGVFLLKKIALLCFLTSLAVSGAFISSYIYEAGLPQAAIASVSDLKYTEQVTARGSIVDMNGKLCVNASVNQSDISKIKCGQRVLISGRGFSDCYGKIDKISDSARSLMNGINEDTVVDVCICFDNECDAANLKSGYAVKIKIDVSEEKVIEILPYKAVHNDDDGREFVYIFDNGTAVKKYIQTGKETSAGIEVLSGITHYDTLLIADSKKITDGGYVRIGE